jgi:hypothetical protein
MDCSTPRVGCAARWHISLWRMASMGGGGVESRERRRGSWAD